jgi:OmpA-OmpF porin, OOP family
MIISLVAALSLNLSGGPPRVNEIQYTPHDPPNPVLAPAPEPHTGYTLIFDRGETKMSGQTRQIVKEAAEAASHIPYTRVEVIGYADGTGSVETGQALSVQRAREVAAELIKNGIPPAAIKTDGRGAGAPAVPVGANASEPRHTGAEIVIR